MAKKNFVVPIIALLSVLGMTGCEKAASTFAPSIGENGNWWVAGTDTGVAAQGPKGDTGASPTISISEDGYWVINGSATDVKAEGTAGAPGQTPTVSINADGFWVINGVATDVSAQGPKGDPGTTPTVSINADGYWVINGTATDVKAEGTAGAPGSSPTVEIGIDDCWWINGVSTGMPAVAHDGNPGAPGAPGDPGATGPEGKSAFEIFMEHYPHYTGTEADWIKGVADGTLAANMPKAGHSGDWTYNSETGKIERTCDECGEVESKDASLSDAVDYPVTGSSIDGVFVVTTEDSTSGWSFDSNAGTWTSRNKGVNNSTSILEVKSLIAGTTLTFHVHVSCEGGSYDYFNASVEDGGQCSLSGNVGTSQGVDYDVTCTFNAADAKAVFKYRKDSSAQGGEDQAVISNLTMNVPIDAFDPASKPVPVVINFDSGNGDADTQQVLWSGTDVSFPTPTRNGYLFDGWFTDESCTTPAPNKFNASCTLHAKWVLAHKVTIVDFTPGADDVTYTVPHGEPLDIEEPVDTLKLFDGFFVLPSCAPGTEFDISSPIKRDTIIYCKWKDAPAYCGTYGGAEVRGLAYGYNAEVELTIAPDGTMTGEYTGKVTGINELDGSLIIEGSSSTDKLYLVDGDMIIGISAYGADDDFNVVVKGKEPASNDNKFILNTALSHDGVDTTHNYGRIFSVDRGNGDPTIYCIFGDTLYKNVSISSLDGDFEIGKPVGNYNSNYYAKDICVKDENGDVITTQILFKSADADYGVYTLDDHTLKVYGDGKTLSLDGEIYSYTKEGGALTILEYSERKTVSTYSAYSSSTMTWNADKGCWVYKQYSYSSGQDTTYTDESIVWRKENSKFVFGNDVIAGNAFITLSGDTFEISRPTFTVTMHIEGSPDSSITKRVGSTLVLEDPSVEANQAFLGWYDNAGRTGEPITEMTTSGDVYAKIVTTYKLRVHKNLTDDPNVYEDILVNEGDPMTPPSVMKDGSTFKGWFRDSGFITPYDPVAATVDVEIWAKWEAGKYANNAANFLDAVESSGTYIDSIAFNIENTHPWTTAQKKDSNNVTHDCMCADNTQDTTDSIIKFTVKADCWFSFDYISSSEANYDYLKVFVGDGTITGTPATTTYGSGTNTTEGSGSRRVFVQANQTVSLVYHKDGSYYLDNTIYLYNIAFEAPSTVTVTYHYNDDDVTADKVQNSNKYKVFNPETPERDGYAFMGWFTDAGLTTPFDESVALTGNVDLYASWYDLSAAEGLTKDDAVSIKAVTDAQVASSYTDQIVLVPGQTDLWLTLDVTESKGGSISSNYLYMLVDNPSTFKGKCTVTSYLNDATDPTVSKATFWGPSYAAQVCYVSIGSGLMYTVGNKIYLHIELTGVTEVTPISFVMYA